MFAGCRCPRCSEATLTVGTVEERKVLGCPHCAGAFVGAELGLRLLAILEPDVPPARVGIPSPACPVCRKDMRRVVAGEVDVETCKVHGVWFDAGDLPATVRAVATKLGRPVPSALSTLEQKRAEQASPEVNPPAPGQAPARRPYVRSDLDVATDIAGAAFDAVYSPIEAVTDVVMAPFRIVGLLAELVD